jgi:hypothetical protein
MRTEWPQEVPTSGIEDEAQCLGHYEIRQRNHSNLKDAVDAALTQKAATLLAAREKTAGLHGA